MVAIIISVRGLPPSVPSALSASAQEALEGWAIELVCAGSRSSSRSAASNRARRWPERALWISMEAALPAAAEEATDRPQ